jgi:hypothetical protein
MEATMATVDQIYEPVVVTDRDDLGSNRSSNRPLLVLARARMSRRTALKGFVTTAVVGALGGSLTSHVALAASSFGFRESAADHGRGHAGGARLRGAGADPLG